MLDNKPMNESVKYPDFSRRLNQLWKNNKSAPRNQTQLSKWLGFAQPTVNNWLNGNALPSLDTALKLCDKFGSNPIWLITGKGPVNIGDEIADPLYKNIINLTVEQRQHVESLVSLLASQPASQPASLLACLRAEPSRAEPSRAEPSHKDIVE